MCRVACEDFFIINEYLNYPNTKQDRIRMLFSSSHQPKNLKVVILDEFSIVKLLTFYIYCGYNNL